MTIQNASEYVKNIWDWGILRGCFGETKIEPTDIDGLVERNGYFLLLETKSVGVPIKDGQRFTHNALIETGAFFIFNIWGPVNDPQSIQTHTRKKMDDVVPCDLAGFRARVSQWYAWANRQPRFSREIDLTLINNRVYTLESERDALQNRIAAASGLIKKAVEILTN